MTSDSLLASATRLPARSAASVASSPAAPTTALTHDVDVGMRRRLDQHARRRAPAVRRVARLDEAGEVRAATRRRWASSSVALRPPVSATTRKCSRCRREHAQRAPADRAGGAEHRHPAHQSRRRAGG